MNRLRIRLPGRGERNRTRGWRRKQGFREGLAKLGAPQAPGALAPPFEETALARRFLGMERGDPGGRNSEFALTTSSRHRFSTVTPQAPSTCRGTRQPHALEGGDRQRRLRTRGQRHRPRAAALAHCASRVRRPSSSPGLGLTSAGIRHPHWPKAPERANHRKRSALGGRLSIEGLESGGKVAWSREVGGRAREGGVLTAAATSRSALNESTVDRGSGSFSQAGSKAAEGHLQLLFEETANGRLWRR